MLWRYKNGFYYWDNPTDLDYRRILLSYDNATAEKDQKAPKYVEESHKGR